jgi:hypothetical protein
MKLVNLRPNLHRVDLRTARVWFSYETPVAYQVDGEEIIVSENVWSQTTNRHIKFIMTEGSYDQIPFEEFDHKIQFIFGG